MQINYSIPYGGAIVFWLQLSFCSLIESISEQELWGGKVASVRTYVGTFHSLL